VRSLDTPEKLQDGLPHGGVAGFRRRLIDGLQERGTYPFWVLIGALSGTFATSFPVTILTIALKPMAVEFGVRETTIAWVISAPLLLSAVAFPLLGKLGDLYGHRRIFLFGFSAAAITAIATAAAWDAWSLIGLRTLAAVVGAATQPTALALIFTAYPPRDRVWAIGWWSMTGAAAPALGLIAGGPLVDLLGWRVVFLIQAGFSLVALGLAFLVLVETPRRQARFDVRGALTLAVAVGGIMLALGLLRDVEPTSLWITGSLAIGLIGLACFIRVERRVTDPLIPLELLRDVGFTAPIISNALNGAAYMGAFVVAPLLFLGIFGYSITQTAAIMLVRTLSLTVSSPFGGRLGMRVGERSAALIGATVMTASLLLIAYAALHASFVGMIVGLVLQGVGHGLSQPALVSAVASSVSESDLGVAAATNRLTGQLGVGFGITTLSLVYGGTNSPDAFFRAFLVGTLLSGLSLGAAAFMPGRDERPGISNLS
jgi:MFS family permease